MNSIVNGTQSYLADLETAFACPNLEPGGNRRTTERQLTNFLGALQRKNPEIRERFRTTAQGPSNFHRFGIASQEQSLMDSESMHSSVADAGIILVQGRLSLLTLQAEGNNHQE